MLRWHWSRFAGLTIDDVYDMLALRSRVFVLEQDCVYLDPDGLDRDAWHLLGRDDAGVLRAYLRVVDPGRKYAVPSIGRVVTDPDARKGGLGHALIEEGLRRCEGEWPGAANRIGAQAHLQGFYGRHGYVVDGEIYIEDDIPHIEMERPGQ
jgi:ElaA protein